MKKASAVAAVSSIPVVTKRESQAPAFAVAVVLVAVIVSLWSSQVLSKVDGLRAEMRNVQASASAGKLNFRLEEKQWEEWYAKYNNDYFNGSLPKAKVTSRELNPMICGQTSMADPKHPTIEMNPLAILGTKHAREVLLHEMIHVKLSPAQQVIQGGGGIILFGVYDDHGADFRQELHRLIGMGAFDDLLS